MQYLKKNGKKDKWGSSSCRFGQFISSTLPTFAVCEKFVVMEINNEEKIDGGSDHSVPLANASESWITVRPNSGNFFASPGNDDDFGGLLSASLILLRNQLLDNLRRLLFTTKEKCTVNAQ